MTLYEYPDYQADKDLTASVVARVERVSARLSKLLDEIDGIEVEAVGGDGDVVLSANYRGRLTSLSLAQGCTTRYTHLALTELINTTIDEAVAAASAEAAMLTGAEDKGVLKSAVEAFIDPDSEIWSV